MNTHHFRLRFCGLMLGFGLASHAVAGDIVVIMAPSAAPVTKEQLANVYLGRSFDYKPLDLPEAAAIHDEFYKKATGREASQVKTLWSRLVFTGHATAPKVLADAAAVKKAVAADPKSVGYIDKADVDDTVRVVMSLD
ncbi:MAG: hypothetical protein ACJ8R9_18305 [Steroidobacteraceae bacterium]